MGMRVKDYAGPWAVKTIDCCPGKGYGGALCKMDGHHRHKEDRRRLRRIARHALKLGKLGEI